jgi:hypothetical protein
LLKPEGLISPAAAKKFASFWFDFAAKPQNQTNLNRFLLCLFWRLRRQNKQKALPSLLPQAKKGEINYGLPYGRPGGRGIRPPVQ